MSNLGAESFHSSYQDEIVKPSKIFLIFASISIVVSLVTTGLGFLQTLKANADFWFLGLIGWLSGWAVPVTLILLFFGHEKKLRQENPGYYDSLAAERLRKILYLVSGIGLLIALIAIYVVAYRSAQEFV